MPFDASNPFFEWAETTPEGRRANYFSRQGQFGRSPNQRKFFQDQFQAVQDRYMGMGLDYLKQGGQNPQSWDASLDEYFAPQGQSQQDWMRQSPRQRGTQQGQFAPPARYLFNSRF